jgi:hypothetical protein
MVLAVWLVAKGFNPKVLAAAGFGADDEGAASADARTSKPADGSPAPGRPLPA